MAISEERLLQILDEKLSNLHNELTAGFAKDLQKAVNSLTYNLDTIKKSIKTVEKRVAGAEDRISLLEDTQSVNSKDIADLKRQQTEFSKTVSALIVSIGNKDEEIEDLRNRQMRNTLVFRGLQESSDEKTWDDTEKALLKTIQETDKDFPSDGIERCHRVPTRKAGAKNIVAQFHSWKDADRVKRAFASRNIRDKQFAVHCDQKYGTRTNARRNMALKLRRELLANKSIGKAYVAYPAKLMTAKSVKDKNYTLHTDFSLHEVSVKSNEIATA